MTQRLLIRRLDLRLRAEFPHLYTEIHELGPYQHLIYAPRKQLDASSFAKTFAEAYRPITAQVEFTNARPHGSQLVEAIRDDEIGFELEGLTFTRSDLQTVIAGKFPGLPALTRVQHGPSREMRVSFDAEVPAHLAGPVHAFLEKSLRGRPLIIDVAAPEPEPNPAGSDRGAQFLRSVDALSFKPIRKRPQVPSFVAQEEEWWFANLEGLFAGRLSPRSFTFTQDAGMACYLQSTVFPQIDLRQALLAYDTIYLEPPLEDGRISPFWESQGIGKDDLLKLVAADRVRLLHSQPEERSDLGFLREAHEANPDGVIGRRMSAAMMIADVVETANEYLLGQPSLTSAVEELIGRIASDSAAPTGEVARLLLYPIQACRECLQPFLDRGLMAYAGMGQGEALANAFQRVRDKDVRLEAGAFGSGVHTAHMLDATFIPHTPHEGYVSTWIEPTRFMGDRLNFYRSMNTRIAAAWAVNERRKEDRQTILPPIPLLEIHPDISTDDVINLTSISSSRRKGRSLISRLANLPAEERAAEIERLRAEFSRFESAKENRKNLFLWIDSVGASLEIAAYTLGWNMLPFLPAFTLTQYALRRAKQAPALDPLVDELERAFSNPFGRNEDLSFLSRVSRVGRLVRQ